MDQYDCIPATMVIDNFDGRQHRNQFAEEAAYYLKPSKQQSCSPAA
jgi:hypothetical protein